MARRVSLPPINEVLAEQLGRRVPDEDPSSRFHAPYGRTTPRLVPASFSDQTAPVGMFPAYGKHEQGTAQPPWQSASGLVPAGTRSRPTMPQSSTEYGMSNACFTYADSSRVQAAAAGARAPPPGFSLATESMRYPPRSVNPPSVPSDHTAAAPPIPGLNLSSSGLYQRGTELSSARAVHSPTSSLRYSPASSGWASHERENARSPQAPHLPAASEHYRARSSAPLEVYGHESSHASDRAAIRPTTTASISMADEPPSNDYAESSGASAGERDGKPKLGRPYRGIKYDCEVCGRRFDRPSSRDMHLNTHTGYKPFECPFANCGRGFSVKSNMRRHYRGHFPPGTAPDDLALPGEGPLAPP